MKSFSFFLASVVLVGCSSNSGVVPMGKDTYLITRQAPSSFSGMGTLKADAIREANKYCMASSKTTKIANISEAQPPYILGNFPKVDVEFSCV